ncbi:MAG: DUF1579 domain-containing protein [Acidobacteria bacterium]|nr:MAG: DUF1579 domain-containing protein [Acidobacteriota bacterium]
MRSANRLFTLLLLSLAVIAPAAAATLDEVIAKHIEARGGRDNWDKIRSIRMTGDFTAFSRVAPFTLTRARDNSYLLDTKLNGRVVIIGHDGATTWWNNHWFKEGAERMTGIDSEVARADAYFVNPLFNYRELGMTAEYLGETEYEGMPALGIKLTRPDGAEETWYLDPSSYLEYARTSPGSDFGRPLPQRTFYDDFREIEGVMIPFLVETQWYTRNRVMHVNNVEVNIEVDPAMFSMPSPEGMAELLNMVGNWKVAVAQRDRPGGPLKESELEIDIASIMDGQLIQTNYAMDDGYRVQWSLSYDASRKIYRLTRFHSGAGYMDIRQGTFDDDGKLTLSNLETETPYQGVELTMYGRFNVLEIAADSFKIEREASIDGGKNWWVAATEVYTRRP